MCEEQSHRTGTENKHNIWYKVGKKVMEGNAFIKNGIIFFRGYLKKN